MPRVHIRQTCISCYDGTNRHNSTNTLLFFHCSSLFMLRSRSLPSSPPSREKRTYSTHRSTKRSCVTKICHTEKTLKEKTSQPRDGVAGRRTSTTLVHCHARSTALMEITWPEFSMMLIFSGPSVVPELVHVETLRPSTYTSNSRFLVVPRYMSALPIKRTPSGHKSCRSEHGNREGGSI